MIDLKEIAGDRYRITLDESFDAGDHSAADKLWNYRIPCKYGHVSVHGADVLAAFTNRKLIISRLIVLPGMRVHQRGDREVAVIFSPDRLDDVCDLFQARRRRHVVMSEERKDALRQQLSRIHAAKTAKP